MITGLDETAAENLRDKVTVQGNLLDAVLGSPATTAATTTAEASTGAATMEAATTETASK